MAYRWEAIVYNKETELTKYEVSAVHAYTAAKRILEKWYGDGKPEAVVSMRLTRGVKLSKEQRKELGTLARMVMYLHK